MGLVEAFWDIDEVEVSIEFCMPDEASIGF